MAEFGDLFLQKLKEHSVKYYLTSGKYKVMPKICQKHVGKNDNVAVLAIGYLAEDILHLREATGGEISLIDRNPAYPYELIKDALEAETPKFLPKDEPYYQTSEGLAEINGLFSEINVRCFVEPFPPLPKAIPDNSLDDVFIMSILATPRTNLKWYEFCKEMASATELKLKPNGKLIVEESFGRDLLYGFDEVIDRGNLKFDHDEGYDERMSSWVIYNRSK